MPADKNHSHGQLPAPSLPDRLAVRPEGELQFEAPASWYLQVALSGAVEP